MGLRALPDALPERLDLVCPGGLPHPLRARYSCGHGERSGRALEMGDPLFGYSVEQHMPPTNQHGDAEVLDGDFLALPGGDLIAPALVPKVPEMRRPVSPGTIEKSASLLRSLSFVASRPPSGETAADRSAAFAQVGQALRSEMHGAQMQRLRQAAPELAPRLQSSLLACCGALLGAQDSDGGFEWAMSELDDLAKNMPPATSAVYPGAYYYEIFTSDVAQLSRALAARRREEAKKAALIADVFSVLARPGVGPGEVHGAGRAAAEAGLVAEASACRAVGELLEREERTRLAHEASSNEAREARRAQKEAEAQTAREARAHADEKHRRQQYADELAGVRAALAREEEVRRKIEAANVATLQELRAQEEARWEAERKCQQEVVRSTELEAAKRRVEEEMSTRVEAAEAREVKASTEARNAQQRYVEAERMRVALQGRVTALEGVKVQIEQQLALEREACGVELGLRQKAESACAEAQQSAAQAQQAAAEATQAAEVAKAALDANTAELASCEERLRVANDGSLDQQMVAAASEEAVKQLKALRAEDANRMQRLNTERATLQQKADDLEARLQSAQAGAERAEVESQKQRYELHAQLTEVHRRCEDLQAQATRAELLLSHERETGLTASDHEKRLSGQLDAERRKVQTLSQQLAAEAALRQKSDAAENARAKELQARDREVELASQRLQAVQGELHRAREEARLAREGMAEARALAHKFERERDAEREEARRERTRRGAGDPAAGRSMPPQQSAGGGSLSLTKSHSSRTSTTTERTQLSPAPSLQQHLQPPARSGALEPGAAPHFAQQPKAKAEISDELSRSDLWNFSAGAMARSSSRGAGGGAGDAASTELPRIQSPYNVQAMGKLAPTSLSQEQSRKLYGSTKVPGVDDDDDV